MTQKDGDYWVASFDQAPLNAIFHNNQGGDSNQTGNIEGLSGDNYFTYDGTSGYTTEKLHHRERTRSRSYTSAWRQDHGICKGIKCTSSVCMVHGRRDRR